jgi:hypothetical protein
MADAEGGYLKIQEHGRQAVISFSLIVLDERAERPIGNPFIVHALWEHSFAGSVKELGTGLAMKLGQSYELRFSSLLEDVYILGYRIDQKNDEIVIVVLSSRNNPLSEGAPRFARVSIVESQVIPVRFVESRDGKRVIVGAPEGVDK